MLLREILYAFQGIQGQVFQWDATHENLHLKSTVTIYKQLFYTLIFNFPISYLGKITKSSEADGTQFGGVGLAILQSSKVL